MQSLQLATALAACTIGLAALLGATPANSQSEADTSSAADIIVVGTGISGLAAALEAARGGLSVTIVDMWSIFGGHAVMSTGGLSINSTDYQRERGIADSPELHARDFMTWGEDPDPQWVDYYARNAKAEIGDWLEALGVTWEGVFQLPGNSVPRFHLTAGRGLGLVTPIYREILRYPNATFRWNFKVTELIIDRDRVVGVTGEDQRTGEQDEIRAPRVLLATGGFQSNLDLVLQFWPATLVEPTDLLVGSGPNSVGSGLSLAEQAGAAFHRMDHQWNYPWGLPHPSYPGEGRGLSADNRTSIWVNAQGQRFVNEIQSSRYLFPAVVEQRPSTYWAIFDEDGENQFFISGSGWNDPARVQAEVLDNPDLTNIAATIPELAEAIGLDPDALTATVERFNAFVEAGVDEDFGRFDRGDELPATAPIDTAPFYAIQFYPLTRKSMGGIAIDLDARVVREDGTPIPGLYAAGETTGMAGVNGSAGLEGTFLGPSLLTGRVAGRTIVADVGAAQALARPTPVPILVHEGPPEDADDADCVSCHVLPELLVARDGYAHFERVHRIVTAENRSCATCHGDMFPFDGRTHSIDRFTQIRTCVQCHLADERSLIPE